MIRLLGVNDISVVVAMHDTYLKANWTEGLYRQELLDINTIGFVAEVDHVVIGFVLGKMLVDSSDLYQIVVLDTYQGQGYGERLLKAYWDEVCARGGKESVLEVNARHGSVIDFYERFGYRTLYVRKHYYGRYRDALVMKKEGSLC